MVEDKNWLSDHEVADDCFIAHGTVMTNELCSCGCGTVKLAAYDENGVVRAIIGHTPEMWRGIAQTATDAEPYRPN